MLITLTGSTEETLRRLVQAGRFRSAEEAVAALVNSYDAIDSINENTDVSFEKENGESTTFADWKHKFDRLLSITKPRNPTVDDSRESIYIVR